VDKDDYCAISFNGLPKDQDSVLLGWMSNWQYAAKLPTSPWRGQMSLPRRLSLLRDRTGLALKQEPVVEPLRAASHNISITAASSSRTVIAMRQAPFELDVHFGDTSESAFGVRLYSDDQHWTEIGFDRKKGEFYMDRTKSGLEVAPAFPARTTAPLIGTRPYDLRLIVDRSSVEAYAQSGTIAMTDLLYPASPGNRIEIFSASGNSVPVKGQIWELRSIWK
jgi:sucrose-6-phosphate hydrolase SacC (GH32 family)